jgi:hypothetical protein
MSKRMAMTAVTALLVLSLVAIPLAASAQLTVPLTVNTQYADGAALSGMWTVLRQGSTVVGTGFSPVTFNLTPGASYTVSVSDYQANVFHHWDDDSTTRVRPVSIISPTTVTAFYVSDAHPLPPPPSGEPTIVMDNKVITNSYGIYSTKPMRAEHASPSSVLVGKDIDSITVGLRRVGTISGSAEIGVFNSAGSAKQIFGSLNAASVPATAHPNITEYTFTIPGTYTMVAGDRIGIRYTGGSSSAYLAVALDQDTSAIFDGTNSYHQYFMNGGWLTSSTQYDMYMVLANTKGAPPPSGPPTVQPVSATVPENSKTGVAITLIGSDPQGRPLTYYPVTQPAKGALSLVSGNIITYTPYDWRDGPDSFQYVAHNGIEASQPATVSINITNTGSKTTSRVTVITVFEDGKSHTGAFTTLSQGSTVINTGFTHMDFNVNNGQTYTVTMSNGSSHVFVRWQDTGSTNPARQVNTSQDAAIIAVYRPR